MENSIHLIDEKIETLESHARQYKQRHGKALGGFSHDEALNWEKRLFAVNYAIVELTSLKRDIKRY